LGEALGRRLPRLALAMALAVSLLAALPQSHASEGDPGAGLARPSVRNGLTDEVFYLVLPDRFFNGDPNNDTGGDPGRVSRARFRSCPQHALSAPASDVG
jgi:hypothetical protein